MNGCYAGPVVFYFKQEGLVLPRCRDLDPARSSAGRDRVLNGVLDDRLKDQMRDRGGKRGRVDVEFNSEPVAKTHLFYFEVATHELRLFSKRYELLLRMVQSEPQKIAESRDHAVGFRRVFRNERRDRVQGIEKKMRMELHLERAKLGLRELRPKRCLLHLAGAEALIIEKRMHADNDQGCDDQIDIKPKAEVDAETSGEGGEELAEARQK